MIVRRLFALLFAVAMSLAPLGMPAMAEAATPASHHGAMAKQGEGSPGSGHAQHGWKAAGGHCDQQPQPTRHHKAADKGCCVAMCVAVVAPSGVARLSQYHAARERPASDNDRRGFLGEIATPPPKPA